MKRTILTVLFLLAIGFSAVSPHVFAQNVMTLLPLGAMPALITHAEINMAQLECPANTFLIIQVINSQRAWISCPPFHLIAPTPTPAAPSPLLPTVTPTVVAQTFSMQPDGIAGVDTFVVERLPNANNANKATMELDPRAGIRAFGLLAFNLSEISPDSEIVGATLFLHNTLTSTQNISFTLHSLLPAAQWTEAASWNVPQVNTGRWPGDVGGNGGIDAGASVAGIDYNEVPLGYFTYAANTPAKSVHAIGLVASQVQPWLMGSNYGLLLRVSGNRPLGFYLSDAADPTLRPRLEIVYR